jgi:hypothetical protein
LRFALCGSAGKAEGRNRLILQAILDVAFDACGQVDRVDRVFSRFRFTFFLILPELPKLVSRQGSQTRAAKTQKHNKNNGLLNHGCRPMDADETTDHNDLTPEYPPSRDVAPLPADGFSGQMRAGLCPVPRKEQRLKTPDFAGHFGYRSVACGQVDRVCATSE